MTVVARALDELVAELLDHYTDPDEDPDGGPGLIRRLDDVALRTGQPSADHEGGRPVPGSRPPATLAAVHWATRIKREAIVLDAALRTSSYTQTWDKALRALPASAEAAGAYRATVSTVGMWHSTCRTVLGLQEPALPFPHVACLLCGQRSIVGRANHYAPRAWCTNEMCSDIHPETGEPTGKPARYDGPRLYLLAQNRLPTAA